MRLSQKVSLFFLSYYSKSQTMISRILNYGIRLLIILIGIVMLSGIMTPKKTDPTFLIVMGIIFILFGLYRLVSYHFALRRYKFNEEDDDEE